ncbi:MAG: phosphate regulon sensor histidine kinase PhoR [Thiotrichales bacterium]
MQMNLWSELWRGLAWIAVATVLGALFGHATEFLIAALLLYIAYQRYQLHRFARWFETRPLAAPDDLRGVWERLAHAAYQESRKSRKRKKRVQKLVRRFNQFSAALPDATIVLNGSNEIVWSNAAAEAYFGISLRDRGHKIVNLIRKPAFVQYLNSARFDEPLKLESPLGQPTILHVQVVPYSNKNKVLAARDMTRLYRLEAMRRDFVGNVSHELRTPLTVIEGYAEMLLDDPSLPDAQRRIFGQVQAQSQRMHRMVDDLLLLSQLETTQPLPSQQEIVDVALLADQLARQARVMDKDSAHAVKVEADPAFGLRGNALELQSAFTNLVSNALRYTPAGGEIVLHWYCDERGGHFAVSDSGIGIASVHLPRLTERFYRVDSARSSATGGTGLGLAIVKHILERHQGTLEIQSAVGEGSRFTCVFPAARVVALDELDPPPSTPD